jgi:HK97 family phage prohead protease
MWRRFEPIEIKELDARTGRFAGWGAIVGSEDDGGDTIKRGSMKKWLKRHKPKIYLMHDTPVGVLDVAEEKDHGLWVEGQPDESRDGLDAREKLKSKALDALSIGYRTVKAKDTGRFKRDLLEIDVFHVGLVPYGMHPGSVITAVKALDLEGIKTIRELESLLRDAGHSRKTATMLCSPGFIANLHQGEPDDLATLVGAIRAATATLT